MKVIVKNARLSFNDIFEAKSVKGGAMKFSATLICLNGDEEGNPDERKTTVTYTNAEGKKITKPYASMQALCDHVAKEKWGKVPPKMKNWAYNKADGSTTREEFVNDDGDFWAGFESETMFISAGKHEAKCKDATMVVLDQAKQVVASNSGLVFSGCFVNAVIDIYPFNDKDTGKPDGVTASLEGIQLKKKGEALGITQIDAADEFDEEEIEDVDADDML